MSQMNYVLLNPFKPTGNQRVALQSTYCYGVNMKPTRRLSAWLKSCPKDMSHYMVRVERAASGQSGK